MQTVPTLAAWQTAIVSASSSLFTSILLFLPNLIGAVLIFILGIVLGGWIKVLVIKLLSALNLSKVFENTTVHKFLSKAEVTTKIEHVVGESLRVLTVLIFTISAINLLGLTTVTAVLTNILAYVPNVLAAVLILALGVGVAGFVEGLVKGSLGAVDLKTARLLAKTSSYAIVIFSTLAALSQLNIAQTFMTTLFTGFVAMIALGLGLSIGLGSKDLVSQILNEWYKEFKQQTK